MVSKMNSGVKISLLLKQTYAIDLCCPLFISFYQIFYFYFYKNV